MRERSYERWLSGSQAGIITGLIMGLFWNVLGGLFITSPAWWILAILPLPGILSWSVARTWPIILPKLMSRERQSFRLTYDVPPDWDDRPLRKALLNMIRIGDGAIDLIWARDGQGFGCWVLFGSCCPAVFERILEDMVPGGSMEKDEAPTIGAGVVVLRWDAKLIKQHGPVPEPSELCREAGVDGLLFRWLDEHTASVAIWGPNASKVIRRWVKASGTIQDAGDRLLYPIFTGDNPWPDMARFPLSQTNPGLSSVSRVQLHSAVLRLNGTDKRNHIVVGQDGQGYDVGFSLPDLDGMRETVRVFGHESGEIVTVLVRQFIQRGKPVLLLDGEGGLSAGLNRLLLREVADKQVLVCDVERPAAQSGFRLNPLWLPGDQTLWPGLFSTGWQEWLAALGVNIGGLGRDAYYHTQVAVVATAALAAQRNLTLDAVTLSEALETPDFLNRVGGDLTNGEQLLGEEIWQWWLKQGQTTSNFDVHMRLGHLRERLNRLLDLPEYRMLWRRPYLDALEAVKNGQSLIWRLPDRRKRLRGYVTSQLLAISTLLAAYSSETVPLVIILHELPAAESWVSNLSSSPGARLLVSGLQVGNRPLQGTLLLSRLQRDDAEHVPKSLAEEIRASDLRRLPDRRLIMCARGETATLDIHTLENK